MTGENWLNVAVVIVGALMIATYAKYILGYSLKEYLQLLLGEFRQFAERDKKPGALNALAIIIASLFLLAAIVIPRFERFLTVGGVLPSSHDVVATSFAAASFIMISTFLCLNFIRKDV